MIEYDRMIMLELIGDEKLATEQPDVNRNNLAYRRKRVKRLKMLIVALLIIFLLLPTILCVLLFAKINSMERQIHVLKVMHETEYKEYVGKANIKSSTKVAHAAEKDKNVENEMSETKQLNEQPLTDSNVKEKKIVYLTFDDGPSEYTGEILDILDQFQVKASFFVVGKTDENSIEMYQRIVKEGHTLGIHSYSHQYKSIYSSTKSFETDFTKLQNYLYDVTGVITNIYRFPGGSSNEVSTGDMTEFIKYLNDQNITYFDWNVTNGDATGEILTAQELADNAINGVKQHSVSMVLMHDSSTKINTVKSLPILIRELKAKGYEILPIQSDTVPIQHVKSESIK